MYQSVHSTSVPPIFQLRRIFVVSGPSLSMPPVEATPSSDPMRCVRAIESVPPVLRCLRAFQVDPSSHAIWQSLPSRVLTPVLQSQLVTPDLPCNSEVLSESVHPVFRSRQ
mmetsp:Transcript_41222/g.61018  ORF Transcript_41222/g.61018 Transcript_41222/m.61018 type:complete len:111 (-) Transcript_41222:63-395(-)